MPGISRLIKSKYFMKVLMIGATGQFAGLVVPELKKRNVEVFALIRDATKAEEAYRNGADHIVIGNLDNAESLYAAVKTMDGVFHINPAFDPHESEQGVAMVKAAKEAGVHKFVFSGVYHPSLSMVNHAAKRVVEEAIYDSVMDFTILQPAMYMQMLEDTWKSAKTTGKITMPYSKLAKMCYVDYRDVAEVAAIAMTGNELSNGTFELCSPGMFNRLDIAELMGKALGKTIEANETTPEDWVKNVQMPDGPLKEGLFKMNQHYNQYGFQGGNDLVLKTILGRKPRTVENFIQELASQSE